MLTCIFSQVEAGFNIRLIQVIKENAANSSRLLAMLKIKIPVASFFESWITIITKWLERIFASLVKVDSIFFESIIGG